MHMCHVVKYLLYFLVLTEQARYFIYKHRIPIVWSRPFICSQKEYLLYFLVLTEQARHFIYKPWYGEFQLFGANHSYVSVLTKEHLFYLPTHSQSSNVISLASFRSLQRVSVHDLDSSYKNLYNNNTLYCLISSVVND